MILIVLLIIPIMFWLIPLARMQQQDRNELRRYVINFGTMLVTCIISAVVLWKMSMDRDTLLVILLAISGTWAALYHLIVGRGR